MTGYKIYRGGNQIGTSASTTYSDTGLLAVTTYSYTVAAFDAAGHTSAQSVSASASTLGSISLPGLTDALVDAPSATGLLAYNSFVPSLTPGTSYVDPVFGATVRRVSSDQAADSTYARNMWWSADGTRYLHNSRIIEVATGRVTHTGIPMGNSANGNTNMGFDPVDPNVLYYYLDNTLRKITLQSGGTWTDTVYWTFPGALGDLGGTLNWLDASGRYMVVRYGPEPSVHVYDRQNMAAGPYANAVRGDATIDTNGYVGITPDGQYLAGYIDQGAGAAGLLDRSGVSWKINHSTRTVAAAPNYFWSLCGDHGSFLSASDGHNYMITFNCYDAPEVWRVDITNNASGLTAAQQKALPNNRRLLTLTWSDTGHMSTVAKGALRDWTFLSTEDSSDLINGPVSPWRVYRQEIIAINTMTGEIRRLAHHRSRSIGGDYFRQPRLSSSWAGEYVGWASNFNQSSGVNIYAIPISPDTTAPVPPRNLRVE
ncbi:MAG: hypothetical protein E6K58_08240 [Nitrospirae bacterium]|nr:MAG: hypothetical protein E6K58_08240 [Nitrospirota bacterium]